MKLGKKIGRIGFVIGFRGPLLFYASPRSLFTYESHLVCPWCPYVDIPFATRIAWVQLGLWVGLLSGLSLAFIGLGIGCAVSRLVRSKLTDYPANSRPSG